MPNAQSGSGGSDCSKCTELSSRLAGYPYQASCLTLVWQVPLCAEYVHQNTDSKSVSVKTESYCFVLSTHLFIYAISA